LSLAHGSRLPEGPGDLRNIVEIAAHWQEAKHSIG